MKRKLSSVWVGVAVVGLVMVQGTMAVESDFVGARAMGMGGANAVSTRDSSAQWYNPAAFGFMHSETNDLDRSKMGEQDWGLSIADIGVGYTMTGDMGKYLNLFGEINFDAFSGDDGLAASIEGVKTMLTIGVTLNGIQPTDAIYVDANVGTGIRVGHWGVGLRMFGEAAAYIGNIDTRNIGIGQDGGQFVNSIATAADKDQGFDNGGYVAQSLSSAQQDALTAKLGSGLEAEKAVNYLDYQLTELKNASGFSLEDLGNAVDLVTEVDFNGNFSNNTSVAIGRAFGVVEVPVSYGHSFFDNSLSVGLTAKGMYGTVTGANIWFFNEDAIDDAVNVASEQAQATLNFGLDLGVLYRLPMVQLAVVGKNLNSPTFKGFTDTIRVNNQPQTITINDVTVDPQVTLGAAFMPSRRFTLEVNYDAFEVGTLLDWYNIQRLSLGTELDVWMFALRLGTYKNIALDNSDWVATAGIGLNVFGFRADIGGAYSLGDSVTYEEADIPSEARLFASISLDY